MRRKILTFSCMLSCAFIIITAVLIHLAVYENYAEKTRREIAEQTHYISLAVQFSGMDYLETISPVPQDHRVTWVAADGKVLFDSYTGASTMENHAQRPEIMSAMQNGYGDATRFSDTISKQTYYYAMRLPDGSVLRTSATNDSIYASLFRLALITLGIISVLIIAAVLAGTYVTKQIVAPINALNLDRPDENAVYDELTPLLTRMKRQNEIIEDQLEEISKKQTEFTALTENMREGFIILDHSAHVLTYNKSAAKLLKLKRNGLKGQSALALNRGETFRNAVISAVNGIQSEAILTINGRCLQLISSPVSEESPQSVILLLIDITEREERDRLRREFTANVSHELKTPLTAISGYAEIIAGNIAKKEDIPRFAQQIHTEAQRLIYLIGDIMMLSKLDEQDPAIPWEEIDLAILADDIAKRFESIAEKRNVTIKTEGESTGIYGVGYLLEQMLFNIVDNAVKYNKAGGSVTISVKTIDNESVVSVSDTGIGIPEAERERVFERFYRVDKSRNESVPGTGLGLSIVKHGAAVHGAKIKLESNDSGGTIVTLRFQTIENEFAK